MSLVSVRDANGTVVLQNAGRYIRPTSYVTFWRPWVHNNYVKAGNPWGLFFSVTIAVALWCLVYFAVYNFWTGYSKLQNVSYMASLYGTTAVCIVYLVCMWFTPMSRRHAANNMVRHAIEKEVLLTVPHVRSQPYSHSKSTVSIFGFMFLYTAIQSLALWLGADSTVSMICGMIGAIKWGDKAGIVLQESYATRQPTDADLQNAIDAMLDANALTLQARTFSFKPMLLSLFVIGAGFVAGALIAIWIL